MQNKGFEMRLAYQDIDSIKMLFSEYTNMLLSLESSFQNYLDLQGYDEELEHPDAKYALPNGRLYIVMVHNEAAGCIGLRYLNDAECEMKRLYVRPQFRGMGIAKVLVDRILKDAREIGYSRMLLDTLPSLESAIRLYEKIGFTKIAPYNDSPVSDTIFMGLDL
jgi:ribosomal protein S18 acetylase RimI-like enzyme